MRVELREVPQASPAGHAEQVLNSVLRWCRARQASVDVWQKVLAIHGLVVHPANNQVLLLFLPPLPGGSATRTASK